MGCNGPQLHFSEKQRVHFWRELSGKLGSWQSVGSASCTQASGDAQADSSATAECVDSRTVHQLSRWQTLPCHNSKGRQPRCLRARKAPLLLDYRLPSGELVASAARGFLTNSKRGHRIFQKVAGTLGQRAQEELGSAGLLWSKAAWDGSLHAAMAALQSLAGTVDAGLQEGFEKVLTSIRQAHMEGLKQRETYNDTFQRSGLYYSSAPKSRRLTATLLIIGGIEPNPGWGGDEVSDYAAQGRTTLGSDIDRGWPLVPLPSLEEVYGSPPSRQAQSMHSQFEAWRSQARLSEQISGGNQRSATSAASESGSELSDMEDEGEDIEGAEFESVDEPQDVGTSRDRAFIDDEDASEDEENEVIAQGRFRVARGSSSDSDVPLLLARRFKPQAPGRATKALQTSRRARSPPSWSRASAEEGSPSQGFSSTVSDGGWADQQLPPATGGRILLQRSEEAAMDTESGSDELPGFRKRRVLDGAARSPQIRRRRRVLLSSSEPSGETGSVSARRSGAAGSEEEVQERGADELVPGVGASFDGSPEPEDDGSLDESDFGEEFATLCVIEPRPRRATISRAKP
ncbi:hypothetical protein KFL_002040020 [Klebsormidium nitens]|uniref:Uncharacterized protein n=1 Tax=Klebsormidium nitens TaxID=105231 RepID=A0A1Y1I2Q0_KLENI|nr:hypothetical protein KFL_002040020 [Klebsormidium nitens]|eukprot:GAQ84743.1 hypothetical protein KFL_002040020 [Klebsormidium nitens]